MRHCYLDCETEKKMKNRMELKKILAQSEDDVNTGRVAPMEDTFNSLRVKLFSKLR